MLTNTVQISSDQPILIQLPTGADPHTGPLLVRLVSGGLTTWHHFYGAVSSWNWTTQPDGRRTEAWVINTYCHQGTQNGAQTWFAFNDPKEMRIFTEMISLQGIGPATALEMISRAGFLNIQAALDTGDLTALAALPGLGGKRGQAAVAHLAKLWSCQARPAMEKPKAAVLNRDAVLALQALGSGMKDAEKLVRKVQETLGDQATTEEIVKAALKKP